MNFAKRKMAITYLVLDAENKIIAYFSITHKALEIRDNGLSNSIRKTLNRYSQFDSNSKSYTVSAFLIAQFGKNLSYDGDEKISGNDLMDSCFYILLKIQHDAGGGVIYLECENNEKLLNFYMNNHNNFRIFGERKSKDDNCDYLQLLRLF